MDCIFCKIIAGEIPSPHIFEDEACIAIRDINPQAKVHCLVMPKKHIANLTEASADPELLGKLMAACAKVAAQEGIAESGYRVATNCGENACQSVPHLHFHVLGGEKMGERMS